jgi:hypothetical protein
MAAAFDLAATPGATVSRRSISVVSWAIGDYFLDLF